MELLHLTLALGVGVILGLVAARLYFCHEDHDDRFPQYQKGYWTGYDIGYDEGFKEGLRK